jgi:hypothetical protein
VKNILLGVALLFSASFSFCEGKLFVENSFEISSLLQINDIFGKPLLLQKTVGSTNEKYSSNDTIFNIYFDGMKIWAVQIGKSKEFNSIIFIYYSPLYALKNGLSIGSSKDEIMKKMGTAYSLEKYRITYKNQNYNLYFNLNGEQLADQIVVEKTIKPNE